MSLEIITFGCRLNSYESEVIKKLAEQANLQNAVIFNSCAVTSEAERQLRQAIRKKRQTNPDATIILTGCAAQLGQDKYAKMSEVNYVIGNHEKLKPEAYQLDKNDKLMVSDIMAVKEIVPHMIEGIEGKSRAFLQIQSGCNHRCTFCIIPYARGNSRSVALGELVQQAKIFCDNGYQELVLTGVDITDYGLDLPGQPKLGQMLRRLLHLVPQLKRLRLSSVDVAEIDEELLMLLATEPRMMPYLHLSLQSGDNMILKRMKRRHNRGQVIDFCHKLRELRPEVTFGADIIAGFPTETDDMFQNSLDIVTQADLQFLHIFAYSPREGTPAARMPQVAPSVRKQRAEQLRLLGEQQLSRHYQRQVGRTMVVVQESQGWGRAADFSLVKLPSLDEGSSGKQLLSVEIIAANNHQHLVGEVCKTTSC